MARAWDWQKWGRCTDLIHKSDLNGLAGKFGCLEQFKRKKEEKATSGARVYENAGGKLCAGTATHEVIARVLRSDAARAVVLSSPDKARLSDASIETSYREEFEKARAGRVVDWYKSDADKVHDEKLKMLRGLFDDMHNHVGEVVLVEAGFVYQLDGMWMAGATDLIYRAPGSKRLSFSDWKTGAQKPHPIELDHGWEAAIYGNALRDAIFIPSEFVQLEDGEQMRDALDGISTDIACAWQATFDANDPTRPDATALAGDALRDLVAHHNAVSFNEYPERIRHVHLKDYVPLTRKSSRMISRPDELAWLSMDAPGKVAFEKGDTRGPAWLIVNRSEQDTPRLRHLLRGVVSTIRFGRFYAAPGEMCARCRFRGPCLEDGYQPIGEEKKQLQLAVKGMDFDGMDGFE